MGHAQFSEVLLLEVGTLQFHLPRSRAASFSRASRNQSQQTRFAPFRFEMADRLPLPPAGLLARNNFQLARIWERFAEEDLALSVGQTCSKWSRKRS